METQINISCNGKENVIKHLQEIILKIEKWGGERESEGLYFSDEEKYGKRRVSIDSDPF